MIRIILTIFVILNFISCKNEEENKKPDGVILSQEDFTNLILDVQLVEGHLNTNRVNQVFIMDSANNYYKEVFDRHGITLQEYKENLKYYSAQPQLLSDIYTNVEKQLVQQLKQYDSITINIPAITPINRSTLTNIIINDSLSQKLIFDTTLTYFAIRDSIFKHFNDSLLQNFQTDSLSFQQSFNVATHTKPMFRLFKNELKTKMNKL